MATACVFCTQCFFLEAAGVGDDSGGGTLIYLPEIRQTDINSFCHVLFCAIANGTDYKDGAQSAYRNLKLRSQPIEEKFGPGTSNPAIFGQLMIDYLLNGGSTDPNLMRDIRLLPSATKFQKQIETWAKTAFLELQAATQ